MPGILVIWWKARWKIQHSEWLMAVSNILKYICISKLKYQEEEVSAGRKIFVCNAQIITFTSRQMRICVTWASFHFTCHYFNTQTGNWQFHTIFFVHKNRFEVVLSAHFLFWEILTWIWRLPFAVYVKLKHSSNKVLKCTLQWNTGITKV